GPVYLSDAESGRPEILDSGLVAAPARAAVMGEVRLLCHWRLVGCRIHRRLQRFYPQHDWPGHWPAHAHGGGASVGPEWPQRRAWGVHAELPRDRPIEDRRWLRLY